MDADISHIAKLRELRTELVEERRACATMKRLELLEEICSKIDAVDRSIIDEEKLAGK